MTQNLLQAARRRHRFEPWEDAVIRRYYPAGGAAACLPHLPSRTTPHIASRAHRLGLAKRRQNSPNTIEPRIVVARKPRRARLVELVREAPAGQSGGNWWRATIAPPAGSNLVHYSQGGKAKASAAAKRIMKRMDALQSGPEWRAFSINGSAEAFRNGDDLRL